MGSATFHYSRTSIFILFLVGIVLLGITTTNAAPHPAISYPRYYSPDAYTSGRNPEYLLQTIAKLRQALINDDDLENVASKRSSEYHNSQYLENYRDGQQDKRESADMGTQRGHSGKSEHMYRMLGSKRGLDFGLGRGFSGSLAAKHLMGLAAASFAGGPGRKRRSDDADA